MRKQKKMLLMLWAALFMLLIGGSHAEEGQRIRPPSESEIHSYLLDNLQWADEGIAQSSIEMTYDEANRVWFVRITADQKLVWRNKDTLTNLEHIDETETDYIVHLIFNEDGECWSARTIEEYLERKSKKAVYHYEPEECARLAKEKLVTLFDLTQAEVDSFLIGYGDVYEDKEHNPLVTILFNDHETGLNNEWLYVGLVNAGTGEVLDCMHRDMMWERLPAYAEKYPDMSEEERIAFHRWYYHGPFNPFGGFANWTEEHKALWRDLFEGKN